MGVANTFTFGGISTSAYGLVVEGSGDYSAPKRAVESITIPGRNGAYILDKGYYENTDVEYRVVVTSDNHGDFLDSIEAFRNAIVSLVGYQRLEDTYHPGEYRMAAYSGGLEEDPTFIGKNAVFKVKFDCKPQRWLTSGETAVSVTSGDTISNPTLFEASPLLEVEGYGTIDVNGTEIEIDDELVGEVNVSVQPSIRTFPYTITFPEIYINPNDVIKLSGPSFNAYYVRKSTFATISAASISSWSGDTSITPTVSHATTNIHIKIDFDDPLYFYYGVPSTKKVTISVNYTQGGLSRTIPSTVYSISYDGNKTITLNTTVAETSALSIQSLYASIGTNNQFTIVSTATTFGHPTYIDCDLGEAYADDSGVISSLNSYIELGSKLPKLSVGSSEITFDNTITDLKVTPRWWKV